jgi:hypothetical protein
VGCFEFYSLDEDSESRGALQNQKLKALPAWRYAEIKNHSATMFGRDGRPWRDVPDVEAVEMADVGFNAELFPKLLARFRVTQLIDVQPFEQTAQLGSV